MFGWLRRKTNRFQVREDHTSAERTPLPDGDTTVRPGEQRWTVLYYSANAQQATPLLTPGQRHRSSGRSCDG